MDGPSDITLEAEVRDLRAENELLRHRVSLFSDLGLSINSSLELPVVLQKVVNAACRLTEARYGALAVFGPDDGLLEFVTWGISSEERQKIGRMPEGLGILGWLRHSKQPLRLADLKEHPRSSGFPPNHPTMKTFLGSPILYRDENLGNLYLTEKQGGKEFSPEDEDLLKMFTSQAAMAIRNARLHQDVEEDITAHKAVEESLNAERQRLEALVNSSPVGVLVVEAGSERILLVNREAQRIVGFQHQVGEHLDLNREGLTRLRPDGQIYLAEDLPISRALRLGESVRAEEVRFEFADGPSLPTLISAIPLYSSEGRITGSVAIIQDISPLDEVEKLRNEFLGMVSYELRTPLTAIKGSAATVLGSQTLPEAGEIRQLFEIVDEQADRLRELIGNLLDITHIETGSLSVTPEAVDLGSVIEQVREDFVRRGGSQGIQVQLPESLPSIQVDPRRITQVLTNLIGNAGKFSPVTSSIQVSVDMDSEGIKISVRDHGRGILADKLPYMFKKFSRVPEEPGPGRSGSGLGLAICKGIVEAHGGRINVASEGEGLGSTFIFTLPYTGTLPFTGATPAAPVLDTTRRADHMGSVRRAGERTKILAVDDDHQSLRYLQRSLKEGGYHVDVTHDPLEVARLIEVEGPDLLLLGVARSSGDGFQLLRRIREFSGVPVIFLTAKDRDEDMVQALKEGADDYISKPYSPSELLARIEVVLRRRFLPDQLEIRPPFVLHNLTINFAERRVTIGDTVVALSATEYKILYELATHAGLVLTHDQMLQRVWGPEYQGETELVRSFIRNLRRKLGDDARNPTYVFTEPQVGYRMPRP